jgi:hypothetical protein
MLYKRSHCWGSSHTHILAEHLWCKQHPIRWFTGSVGGKSSKAVPAYGENWKEFNPAAQ